jgi:hypothetical protein
LAARPAVDPRIMKNLRCAPTIALLLAFSLSFTAS